MRKLILVLFTLWGLKSNGQINVMLIEPTELSGKVQLWNMVLTNIQNQPITLKIELLASENSNGQPVFMATTRSIILPANGNQQISANQLDPIQYTSLNSNYRIDPGPAGLIPPGSFNLCYHFQILQNGDAIKTIEECRAVNVPVLSPPLLISPENKSIVDGMNPTFSWLPPSPIQLFNNLSYNFKIVEILPGQSNNDAVQQNAPVYSLIGFFSPNVIYGPSLPSLQSDKQYAWQVTALNNSSEVSKSEIWSFKIKDTGDKAASGSNNSTFLKLSKIGTDEGRGVFQSKIRIAYINETADTVWNILVKDLSLQNSGFVIHPLQSLQPGQNLMEYDASIDLRFIDGHEYLLQIPNSRNELWQIKFIYRKSDSHF